MLLGHRHGKPRQGSVGRGERLSLQVQPLSCSGAVLGALPGCGCREQPASSSVHQTPRESPAGTADCEKVLILLAPDRTQDIPLLLSSGPWEGLEKHLERSRGKGSPDPARSWVGKPGAQRQPVPVLCPGSRWPEQWNQPHRLQVLRMGIAGAKQAGGRFVFSRRVGVL